jgi:uncharacterized membrane protein YgaE (UPF0421/DUF939 family)
MFTSLFLNRRLVTIGICVSFALTIIVYVYSLKSDIQRLENKVKDTYIVLANVRLEGLRYKTELDNLNNVIKQLRVDKTKSLAKLNNWINQPKEIRYKVIYKTREVKSNDCEDIKSLINDVRHIKYEDL